MAVNRDNLGSFPCESVREEIFGGLFDWIYAGVMKISLHG
jgi:hypothetical protein